MRCLATLTLIIATALGLAEAASVQEKAKAPSSAAPSNAASKYIVEYPAAEAFRPPIKSFFAEATRTRDVVDGRTISHPLNLSFGLKYQRAGAEMVHVGGDCGFFRVGEPVVAVAAGVVRMSECAAGKKEDGTGKYRLPWGNVIAIEHRLPKGEHVVTVYGHLGHDRRVKVGDIVEAGQRIGEIGKQDDQENGGYQPHLHFGVREGGFWQPGATLFEVPIDGRAGSVRLIAIGADEIEVAVPKDSPAGLVGFTIQGERFNLTPRDGKHFMSSRVLEALSAVPGGKIVGYQSIDLGTEGWLDPVAFLREHKGTKTSNSTAQGEDELRRRSR